MSDTIGAQLSLFGPLEAADDKRARFWRFHEANPQVYTGLVREAKRLLAVGHRTYSIQALFEVLRWHRALETTDDSGFKLSNDYKPFYSRLIDEQEPDLKGFFVLKQTKWGTL